MRKLRTEPVDARSTDTRILHTGEGRVLVPMSVMEAEELAFATSDGRVRARLIQAIGLLDFERAESIQEETDAP